MKDDPVPSDKRGEQAAPSPASDANAPTIILSKPVADANAATIIMGKTVAATVGISTERVGDFIGRYKLIEELGVGGFGIVWRAEQFEPIQREIALKVGGRHGRPLRHDLGRVVRGGLLHRL
ncbi:MAG: hypothetical protein WCN98_14665, partial [Verrucomicrobiaceae bacterium]